MNLTEKRFVSFSIFISALTGLSIYLIDEFFKVQTSWGPESSPYLSLAKALHYIVTPLLLISIGLVLKNHIFHKLKNFVVQKRKRTGFFLCVFLLLSTFSGQSLLFVVNEFLAEVLKYTHLASGLLLLLIYLAHNKKRAN